VHRGGLRRPNWVLAVAVSLLVVLAAGPRFPGAIADTLSGEAAEEGHRLAQRLCSACHDIEPGGSTPRAGPPLAELARQPGYSVQWFRGWLANPHLGTPIKGLSESYIENLSAYYETLVTPRAGHLPGSGSFDFGASDESPEGSEGFDVAPETSNQEGSDLGYSSGDVSTGDDFSDFDLEAPSEDTEKSPDSPLLWQRSGPERR
jgi:mono/diheme cytochrome c family protein